MEAVGSVQGTAVPSGYRPAWGQAGPRSGTSLGLSSSSRGLWESRSELWTPVPSIEFWQRGASTAWTPLTPKPSNGCLAPVPSVSHVQEGTTASLSFLADSPLPGLLSW